MICWTDGSVNSIVLIIHLIYTLEIQCDCMYILRINHIWLGSECLSKYNFLSDQYNKLVKFKIYKQIVESIDDVHTFHKK